MLCPYWCQSPTLRTLPSFIKQIRQVFRLDFLNLADWLSSCSCSHKSKIQRNLYSLFDLASPAAEGMSVASLVSLQCYGCSCPILLVLVCCVRSEKLVQLHNAKLDIGWLNRRWLVMKALQMQRGQAVRCTARTVSACNLTFLCFPASASAHF